ncbi:hypothetical protein B0I35DRAFT_347275 [Stachybotrys elegans]|uniref:NAD(P)-binding protein n=1 Tax=Stachybotrys elegans TaxID=80388 RepID=A0A8K0SX12_9HYPO|nr:hypothetical protein B0I35DRAFT_347275 [Stachybotrys elegans]
MDALSEDHFIKLFQFTPTVYNDQYPSIDPTSPSLALTGKVAVITGASRGLGAQAFAPAFAKAGVKGLVLIATDEAKLKSVEEDVKRINADIQVLALSTNIADERSVEAAFDKIKSTFGHADILINNAGVLLDGEGSLVGDFDPDLWWRDFEINTKGTFLMSRGFIRQLPSKDTPATMVNLVTTGAWMTFPHLSGYCISKGASLQLAQHVAAGYPNITSVSLHPGMLDTDMMMEEFRRFTFQSPDLVGGLAVWLSHPHAKFLSGRTIASFWSVDDLLARKDEIVQGNLLQMGLSGNFLAGQSE